MNRRRFLLGVGGAVLALPFLESGWPKPARAASRCGRFAVFVRQGCGVQQEAPGEPERFWPSFAPGAFAPEDLAADTGRALSELADHAARLTFVRGIRYAFPGNACKHSTGGNQTLTAANVSDDDCNTTKALGESIDNLIVRQLGVPGDEPLTLYAGRKSGSLDEVLSYRGPRDLRAAERNPYTVYQSLFGLSSLSAGEQDLLRTQRKSVNDLVRADMQALLSRNDLSKADRTRLDLHFSSIRDFENAASCGLGERERAAVEQGSSALDDDDTIETVIKLHFDLIVLALACGLARAVTLQLGMGPDRTQYWIDGVKQPSFHSISHRETTNPVEMHHRIDRKLLGLYKYLLDKLAQRTTPDGTLLDQGVAVYLNDIATGLHSYDNVPWIVAGNASGNLRTGLYVDAGGVTNNKILNTIGAAVGCTNAAGLPLDDFGDPSLEKGRIDAMLTAAGSTACVG